LRFGARGEFSKGYLHPGCFGKRGCKRLKTKETNAEKRAKRGQRGGKLLKTKAKWRVTSDPSRKTLWVNGWQEKAKRDLTPPGDLDGFEIKGLRGKGFVPLADRGKGV
jgi:hypothetical protein